ncbi:MAG: GH3 auxin-responsive promoter family protein, partial [Pyrinomonadaceae bacterium]|nr:GH3 auxin-responsive promoter family protein [Sphingobacteriaceae bacterium]
MGLKADLSKPFAAFVVWQTSKWKKDAVSAQNKVFQNLISNAASTSFGSDHNFSAIKSYEDFKRNVPVRDYEDLKPYIERVVEGEPNVLWPGKPAYFAKTSGTTSGVKFIPISKESMPEHIKAARNALLTYIHETGNTD